MGTAKAGLWQGEKPCYSKTDNVAVVALHLQQKSFVASAQPVNDFMVWLHCVHKKLDAVVVKKNANKFSGSSESYLVVLPCKSEVEAEEQAQELGKELLEAAKQDATVRAVGGYGEVGFGVLGSTGWNYQFYGALINSMKLEAKESIPGQFQFRLPYNGSKQDDEPSCSKLKRDCQNDVDVPTYEEWRAKSLQHSELWVLMITLLLSVLAILGVVEKTQINNQSFSIPTFFTQLQCFLVNLGVIGIWFVNRKLFVRHHQAFMVTVWIFQILNRLTGTIAMPVEPKGLFQLYPTFRLIAANGPEKLLLISVPMVDFSWSIILHVFGTLSAIIFSFCSCATYKSGDISDIPFECKDFGWLYTILVNCVVSLALPVLYARYTDQMAYKEYLEYKNPKSKKQV